MGTRTPRQTNNPPSARLIQRKACPDCLIPPAALAANAATPTHQSVPLKTKIRPSSPKAAALCGESEASELGAPMRRPPADWQRQSRRSRRDGVRSGTAQSAAINSTVAYRGFLSRQRNSGSAKKAQNGRMVLPQRRVEGAAKIATRPSSDPHSAVVFLP